MEYWLIFLYQVLNKDYLIDNLCNKRWEIVGRKNKIRGYTILGALHIPNLLRPRQVNKKRVMFFPYLYISMSLDLLLAILSNH